MSHVDKSTTHENTATSCYKHALQCRIFRKPFLNISLRPPTLFTDTYLHTLPPLLTSPHSSVHSSLRLGPNTPLTCSSTTPSITTETLSCPAIRTSYSDTQHTSTGWPTHFVESSPPWDSGYHTCPIFCLFHWLLLLGDLRQVLPTWPLEAGIPSSPLSSPTPLSAAPPIWNSSDTLFLPSIWPQGRPLLPALDS